MGNKLHVGNLSYSTNEDSLRDLFGQVGTVQSCKVIIDRDTGRSKGFAFVEMGSDDEAQNAVEQLNGKNFDGRQLRVSEARPQEPRGPRGGGGGGGGGHRGW